MSCYWAESARSDGEAKVRKKNKHLRQSDRNNHAAIVGKRLRDESDSSTVAMAASTAGLGIALADAVMQGEGRAACQQAAALFQGVSRAPVTGPAVFFGDGAHQDLGRIGDRGAPESRGPRSCGGAAAV